ncbi:10415_t:CDS:1 [Ambispora leptoticha]|uniref:10415_t:CDS:1 n=1 Tax=Ambispora leptoticha TaxID=144679 RepID=A0A9N9EP07_9GLOM|nr:10415_t:CDS:1 [Ambispora leptoticha]
MNKEEIEKRSNKIKGITKIEDEENMQIEESKKRRQEEKPEKKTESKERNTEEPIQQTESKRKEDKQTEIIVISDSDASSYDWLKEKGIEVKKTKKDKEAPIERIAKDEIKSIRKEI